MSESAVLEAAPETIQQEIPTVEQHEETPKVEAPKAKEGKNTFKYRIDAEDVTRLDEFSVPPDQIIMELDQNGREKPHAEASVNEMVESLLSEGQIQAIVCRKVQGSKLKVALGFRRLRAMLKINNTPELLARAKVPAGEKMKIRVKVREMNDEEAFLQNLAENMIRDDLTGLDHAHNQRRLRDQFHKTDTWIANYFKQSLSYVSLLKKANQIPAELQQLIRDKKLTLSDGIDLLSLPEQAQVQVVHEAQQTPDGKVDSGKVRNAVRTQRISEGGKQARTVREVRKFFEGLKEEEDTGKLNKLADAALKFLDGRILEKTFKEKLWELLE
jgi:ParB/RepB/Spo0J family partition protein